MYSTGMKKMATRFFPGAVLLAAFVVIALCTYQDYGVAWDSAIQREMGKVSYDYIFNGDNRLDTYIERDHGTGFELVLLVLEKVVSAKTFRDIFLARHLASHLFFLAGAFAMYVLALRLFNKQWLAILAFLFFVLSPRLYAHSFFNSKDIPLLSMFVISFMAAEWAFRKNTVAGYIVLGLCVGYATSIRILGVYLFCWFLFFLAMDLFGKTKTAMSGRLKNLFGFITGFASAVYIFWPTLWKDPVTSFIACFKSNSRFRWDGLLLLNGEDLQSIDLPWYYLPEWFLITTPILYLLLGGIGLVMLTHRFVMHPKSLVVNGAQRNFLLYIACFLGPFLIIILLHSIVYDGWRHVYFVYPAFIMIALYGLNKIFSAGSLKWFAGAAIIAQSALVLNFMLRFHPFHQVYFNELVSHKEEYLRKNFDYDYWGSSYKQAIEYIVRNDKRDTVKIETHCEPILHNIHFLKEEDRVRVKPTGIEQADYYLTNFRWHPQDYDFPDVYYEVKVQNSTIVRVYKLR